MLKRPFDILMSAVGALTSRGHRVATNGEANAFGCCLFGLYYSNAVHAGSAGVSLEVSVADKVHGFRPGFCAQEIASCEGADLFGSGLDPVGGQCTYCHETSR
jgi:hypothetical protein